MKAHNAANKARRQGAETAPPTPRPAPRPQPQRKPPTQPTTTTAKRLTGAARQTAVRRKKKPPAEGGKPKPSGKRQRGVYETPTGMNRRGWTPTLIARYLGEPDQLMQNPHYRSAAPMQGYKRARVAKIEEQSDLTTALAKVLAQRAARSASALKAAQTRRRKMDEWPDPETIFWYADTPSSVKEAEKMALDWWREANKTGDGQMPDESTLGAKARRRLTEDYLLEKWIDYKEALYDCPRVLVGDEGLDIIERRMNRMVHERFPALFRHP